VELRHQTERKDKLIPLFIYGFLAKSAHFVGGIRAWKKSTLR
jgi:hypothetical protein